MSSIDALERCVGALKSAADLRKMEDRRDAATAEGLTFDGSATAGRDERRAGTRTTVCTPASASPLHSYAYHKSAARLITAARECMPITVIESSKNQVERVERERRFAFLR